MCPNGGDYEIVKAWLRAGPHGFWAVPLREKGLWPSKEWSPTSPSTPCLTLVYGSPAGGTATSGSVICLKSNMGKRGRCETTSYPLPPPTPTLGRSQILGQIEGGRRQGAGGRAGGLPGSSAIGPGRSSMHLAQLDLPPGL